MKTILSSLLIALLAFALVSSVHADDSATVKKDLAKLQGQWSMVSGTSDGNSIPDSIRPQMKRVCQGDVATTTMGDWVIYQAKITLAPDKKPKAIDFQMTGGMPKGKTQLGIYEVDGNTLKSCISAPGDPRPADFTSKPGDHRTLTVWKREKATAQPEQK